MNDHGDTSLALYMNPLLILTPYGYRRTLHSSLLLVNDLCSQSRTTLHVALMSTPWRYRIELMKHRGDFTDSGVSKFPGLRTHLRIVLTLDS
jgi:hypothetical protein